jgi:hypothetical protein
MSTPSVARPCSSGLRELRRGDMVTIGRADGSSVRFVVQRTEQYPKDRFPTDEVYYPTLTRRCGW